MACIRATCADCGDVELTASDVTVVDLIDHSGSYRFRCPKCRRITMKKAELRTKNLLVAAGCDREIIDRPREQRPSGAPFTDDDCIELHRRWADEATFVADLDTLA